MAGFEYPHRQGFPLPSADPLSGPAPMEARAVVGYLASFAMTAVATVVAVGIDIGVMVPNVSLVFVVPVIIASVAFGLGPALFSAVLGALAYNFFLTEPRYTLLVNDPADVWAIGLLFLIGLIVSSIGFTSRRRAANAALLNRQVTVLQGYGRDAEAADNAEAIASSTARALAALFQVPVVVMLLADGHVVSTKKIGDVDPQEAEFEAARLALETGLVARAGLYPTPASRFDFWPVGEAVGQSAVIGLVLDPDERPSAPDTLVDIVRSILRLALYHHHVGGEAGSAR
ncbi:DUF4118 domain-containing protein [Mycoplana dimorpha]|uniref:Uncharacterized protein DUF4118 n=1 Tax=Mycoplana dimorpha TaxID=28320 RepID=A0A2T5B5R8_MYCDI|nr:DUF4118 domain-containing protein [Mycoplana dimorpha]PTM94327.1 uncharacterized protein DUF4118 [Mycoplana dimorpha]